MLDQDTIVGVATPPGEGGIGIIRMSGLLSADILNAIFHAAQKVTVQEMKSNTLYYGWIHEDGRRVDEVLAVVMRKPRSYTREDVVEIHCHGGMIPIRKTLELCRKGGARLSEPGEFTKRAFLNGRLDLAQAEAVMDLIQAKTDMAAKSSLEQMEGSLSHKIRAMQEELLNMLALIEVNIDYPEEDVEQAAMKTLLEQLKGMAFRLEYILKNADTGRIIREGLKTAIVGKPNVGKSSLLNALLRENRAIVTEIPGTTRDILEEYLNIRGILIRIIDTAGIRNTEDMVEALGVERSRQSIQAADLILFVVDRSDELQEEDIQILKELEEKKSIIVLNKSDKPSSLTEEELEITFPKSKLVAVSAREGTGLDVLEDEIFNMVFEGKVQNTREILIANLRHREAIEKARNSIYQAMETIESGLSLDFVSIDVRGAWHALGEITGETVDEDVIDRIFSQFCLGK